MRKHNVHRVRKATTTPPVKPLQWPSVILALICACVLAAGFFYAARQHFSTIDLGLKNSKLRKQIEDLESERRRLVLAKEVSLSPVEIARNTRPARAQEKPLVEPQAQETAKIEEKESPTVTTQPVQISMREIKKPAAVERKTAGPKKVVKPGTEQATQKTPNPNERPRVFVETEKRVASVTVKSF